MQACCCSEIINMDICELAQATINLHRLFSNHVQSNFWGAILPKCYLSGKPINFSYAYIRGTGGRTSDVNEKHSLVLNGFCSHHHLLLHQNSVEAGWFYSCLPNRKLWAKSSQVADVVVNSVLPKAAVRVGDGGGNHKTEQSPIKKETFLHLDNQHTRNTAEFKKQQQLFIWHLFNNSGSQSVLKKSFFYTITIKKN